MLFPLVHSNQWKWKRPYSEARAVPFCTLWIMITEVSEYDETLGPNEILAFVS
jgi:hypothetical protein